MTKYDLLLTRFALSGRQLGKMPEDEATFMIQMSHLCNSISILHKLIVYTTHHPDNDVQFKANIAMESLLSRILAGVLCGGWEAFKRSFYGTKLSQVYTQKLPVEAQEALDELKSYFSKDNMIKEVRNRFSYHYDREDIKKQLQRLPPDGEYEFFLGDTQGNSLFYASEDIVGFAQIQACAEKLNVRELGSAFDKFYEDIVRLSRQFMLLSRHCVGVMLREGFSGGDPPPAATVRVTGVPSVTDVTIPYFTGPPIPKRKDA